MAGFGFNSADSGLLGKVTESQAHFGWKRLLISLNPTVNSALPDHH